MLPLAGSSFAPPNISTAAAKAERKRLNREARRAQKIFKQKCRANKPARDSKPTKQKFLKASSSKGANGFAEKMRNNPTPAERILQQCAKKLGYYIDAQAVFGNPHIGHRIVDVLITHRGHSIALEADGAQHFTPEGIESDKVRSQFFSQFYPAVRFLRYRNYEIKKAGFIDRLKLDLELIVNGAVSVMVGCGIAAPVVIPPAPHAPAQ